MKWINGGVAVIIFICAVLQGIAACLYIVDRRKAKAGATDMPSRPFLRTVMPWSVLGYTIFGALLVWSITSSNRTSLLQARQAGADATNQWNKEVLRLEKQLTETTNQWSHEVLSLKQNAAEASNFWNQEISSLKNQLSEPKFTLEAPFIMYSAPYSNPDRDTTIYVLVSLINRGADSVADAWKLHIKSKLYDTWTESAYNTSDYETSLNGAKLIIPGGTNSFAERIATTPIKRGAPANGYIFFYLEGINISALKDSDPSFEITCRDISQKTYTWPIRPRPTTQLFSVPGAPKFTK